MPVIYDLDNEYGARIIGDGGEDTNLVEFRSGATAIPALAVTRSVQGSVTVAPLRIAGTSAASAAVLGFGGGFISVTSILGIAATGAGLGFSKVIPVELAGVMYGIPVTSLASLTGAATF